MTLEKRRPAVCILGAPLENGNRGVLALAVSLLHLVKTTRPDLTPVYHYGQVKGGAITVGDTPVQVCNYRLAARANLSENILAILLLACLYRVGIRKPARTNRWLASLLQAEFIGDIRGGDSFSDIYGIRRFFEGCLPLLTVLLLDRSYALLPQTFGPFRSRASRMLASLLFRRATVILTRDRNCDSIVMQLGGRPPAFCPDVAFTLPATEPRGPSRAVLDAARAGGLPVVGLNISGLLYMGGYTSGNMFGLKTEYKQLVQDLVRTFLESTDAMILLVPHVVGEQEQEACAEVMRSAGEQFPGRVFALDGAALNERELKWLIGRTDFFMGARMHACIAALSQSVPAIGMAYSDKFRGVFESANVGANVIDLRSTSKQDVIAACLDAFADRRQIRERLQGHIPVVQGQVTSVFRQLLGVSPS